MRRSLGLRALPLLAAAVVPTFPAVSRAQFEGVISARIRSEMGSMDATYSIKGERMRMDMASAGMGGMAMIFDKSANKSWTLMSQRRMYMETDLSGMPRPEQQGAKSDFKWTGTSQTIAGVKCDNATDTQEDGTVLNMCIAKGIVFMAGGGMGPRGAANTWQQRVQGGFPLRVQRAGDKEAMFEVTGVEKKKLSDDLFAPPADWQKMSMPMGMPMGRP